MIHRVVRRAAAFLTAAALVCAAGVGTASAVSRPPRAVALDAAGWEYASDPADAGLRDGWTRGHGGATWSAVDLPRRL